MRLAVATSAELGMATLLVTRDMGVVAGHADRVFIMYAEREAETGTTGKIFAKPRQYTGALLGSGLVTRLRVTFP